MTSIRCGHCKKYHDSVEDVKRCALGEQPAGPASSLPVPERKPATPMERIRTARLSLPDVTRLRFALEEYVTEHGEAGEVRRWNFYRLDMPQQGRWRGYTFLKIQASDDLHDVRAYSRVAHVLEELIRVGVEKAVANYGHQIGECGICGKTLTDPDSIARGIGPVCYSKMGW